MKGIRIEYGDVAVGAKESFVPSATDKADFVDLSEFNTALTPPVNYGNPCDLYSVILDGSSVPVPEVPTTADLGWWSEHISDDNGVFGTPITLTLTSDQYFTSSGITLDFDTHNGIFANAVSVQWYRGDELIHEKQYIPDSAYYFCEQKADYYNKLVITFYSMNMPQNRLKLRAIEYGMRVTFTGEELRSCKLIQEMDPISSQISINTCDFTIDSKRPIEYTFQERQAVTVYFNDVLRSTTFITSAKRKQKNTWDIQSEDYIGLLETVTFYGGMYTRKSSLALIEDIMSAADVPYEIAPGTADVILSGYIPLTNCREALMQVAFASGVVVDTTNSDKVVVSSLTEPENPQIIRLDRIMQGQSFNDDTIVTAVELTSHSYIPTEEIMTAYNAADEGTGDNIVVKFTEPLHSLSITNGNFILKHTNYAIITAYNGCVLTGKKYDHQQRIHRADNEFARSPITTENVVSIDDANLVSADVAVSLLPKIAEHYFARSEVSLKIVEGKSRIRYGKAKYGTTSYMSVTYDTPTKVGEVITCQTEYLGDITGKITKQTFDLSGGIIVKDTQMKRS